MKNDFSIYVGGSTEPWAASVIQALIRLSRPRRLLELGTFEGRTTKAITEAMPADAFLSTVDISDRRVIDALPRSMFYEIDAIEFLKTSAPDDYDFVFVDDDHTIDHVRQEVELLIDGGLVSKGGLVVLHDVIGPFGLDSIIYERGGFIIDLPLFHAAGGLGVIEVE